MLPYVSKHSVCSHTYIINYKYIGYATTLIRIYEH